MAACWTILLPPEKIRVYLVATILLASAENSWALRDCPGTYDYQTWHNCTGKWTTTKFTGENTYVGEFQNGKFNGHGTFTFGPSSKWAGDTYIGEFKNNQYHGFGTYTWSDGGKYAGEFKDNSSTGQGTYRFGPSSKWAGDKYVGTFRNWEFHGPGTYYHADGRIVEGIWQNNKLSDTHKTTMQPADQTSPDVEATSTTITYPPIENAKRQCADIGFKKGTEKFGDCVMKLLD